MKVHTQDRPANSAGVTSTRTDRPERKVSTKAAKGAKKGKTNV